MIDLEDVYPWLAKFGNTHISSSSEEVVNRITNELGKDQSGNKTIKGRGYLNQLKELAGNIPDNEEITAIYIAFGYHAYQMGHLAEAEAIFGDAVSRSWSNIHDRAVAYWMLGCVQWQSTLSRQQAIISWRNSVSDFNRLAQQPGLPLDQKVWYQDAWYKTNQSMLEAMKELGNIVEIGQPSRKPDNDPLTASEQFSISRLPSESTATFPLDDLSLYDIGEIQSSGVLQLFTISEEIPAGDFGPGGMDPFPKGTVDLNRLSIDGHPYSIHSTRGRKVIKLPLDQKMVVVKVKGDSMDLDNIAEQDYILLTRVDVPLNGDLVMAEIVGVDKTAILKRYLQEGENITLQPHSSNSIHKTYDFKKDDKGFCIRGVVIAVLKPIKMRFT